MSEERKVSLEERFDRLDEIITQMEDSSIGLDKSFELYKSGLDEVKSANEMLDSMEKAMLVLNEDGNLEEF
ncbi:MAG: exodeoxyribonuclease VII small subunit [Agathobacter sp.]|nr:exodeoxyribonuclease VII small subunit [Agathobacter sp.]